jgi:hypothetical protein
LNISPEVIIEITASRSPPPISGKTSSRSEKKISSRMPSQKTGIDSPSRAKMRSG